MLKQEKTRTLLFEERYSPSFALHVARFLQRKEVILWSLIEDDDNTWKEGRILVLNA